MVYFDNFSTIHSVLYSLMIQMPAIMFMTLNCSKNKQLQKEGISRANCTGFGVKSGSGGFDEHCPWPSIKGTGDYTANVFIINKGGWMWTLNKERIVREKQNISRDESFVNYNCCQKYVVDWCVYNFALVSVEGSCATSYNSTSSLSHTLSNWFVRNILDYIEILYHLVFNI